MTIVIYTIYTYGAKYTRTGRLGIDSLKIKFIPQGGVRLKDLLKWDMY